VLKVRLEAESSQEQKRLSEALALLAVEDPSLVVEETETATLLSGLGELHIEVTLDRLYREFGLSVLVGAPSVAYRETLRESLETNGLVDYNHTIGGTRLQASVHLRLEPVWNEVCTESSCMVLTEPVVSVGELAKDFLGVDTESSDEDLAASSEIFRALVQGCQGALKRGLLGPYPIANVNCRVLDVDAEDGLPTLLASPGSLRAAAANAVATALVGGRDACCVLEPKMSVEITLPNETVGTVCSDLTGRRGTISDVFVGDDTGETQTKALIRGDVPLAEILGYASNLRSLTGGEGTFTAEYKGHSPS
jgi:elongation factor G